MATRVSFPNILALSAILASPFTTVSAQQQNIQAPPSISVSSQEDVKVTPDRATIHISVQTRAATAAQAAADNAQKQNAVLKALKALGLTDSQLGTSNYTVQPEYKYPNNESPQVVGYQVMNTVLVELKDISMVGKTIDAALGAGANQISSLNFYASNITAARQTALTAAIAKARAEATAAAQAAGGTLGTLLELSVSGENSYPPPRPMYARVALEAGSADTSINPGDQTVTVSVQTRWLFVNTQ